MPRKSRAPYPVVNFREGTNSLLNALGSEAIAKTGATYALFCLIDGHLHMVPVTDEGIVGFCKLTLVGKNAVHFCVKDVMARLGIAPGRYPAAWRRGSLEIDLGHPLTAAPDAGSSAPLSESAPADGIDPGPVEPGAKFVGPEKRYTEVNL